MDMIVTPALAAARKTTAAAYEDYKEAMLTGHQALIAASLAALAAAQKAENAVLEAVEAARVAEALSE